MINEKGINALEGYLKQFAKISERLRVQLEPVLNAPKKLEEVLRPTFEFQKVLGSKLEPFLEQQKELQKAVDSINSSFNYRLNDLGSFANQIDQYQKNLKALISPAFTELQHSFDILPPKIQEALLSLAQECWYFDFNMPLSTLWELRDALFDGEINDVEKILVDYFELKLEEIKESMCEQFPHRCHIIKAAVEAHQNGEYYLSIPVLMAQTDGICKEVVDQYLFMKKDKKPKTAIFVEQLAADTYKAALLSPLATSTPIGASEAEREKGFNQLNRHMVLHGESLDYGSKVNSLKAISLINYVSQALNANTDANNL